METGRALITSLKGRTYSRLGFYDWEDRGATAVEYGFMVAFIALVIIAGVTAFGVSVLGLFELIKGSAPFS